MRALNKFRLGGRALTPYNARHALPAEVWLARARREQSADHCEASAAACARGRYLKDQ